MPILTLDQLDGSKAAGTLTLFLDTTESCSSDDEDRSNIAKTWMGRSVALLLKNIQEKGRALRWRGVEAFFKEEFVAEITFDGGRKEIEGRSCEWTESPQASTNNLICQYYALLQSTHPRERMPSRHQLAKKKLCRGLTKDPTDELEACLDEGDPLNKFIDRLEFERQFLVDRSKSFVGAVPKDGTEHPQEPQAPSREAPAAPKAETEELRYTL